jgi:membrane-associated protein
MLDISELIKTFGYLGLFFIIFAESGLFVGFFLPGDSVLFTAGFLASQGYLNIAILIVVCFFAAVLGDSFGYYFGTRIGGKIFTKEESLFFSKRNVGRAQKFFKDHGKKTIIFARFIPVVRTFAPILAGVGEMHYGTFISYNLVGGLIWAVGLPALGYFLGNSVPGIDQYIFPVLLVIIILSVLPTMIHILKDPRDRKNISLFIKGFFK